MYSFDLDSLLRFTPPRFVCERCFALLTEIDGCCPVCGVRYLITGSDDGTARVFDAASGAEICRLTHDRPVEAVAFSPDGTRVATGSADGTARVWAVSARDLIEQARARLSRNLSVDEWKRYRLGDYRKLRDDLP